MPADSVLQSGKPDWHWHPRPRAEVCRVFGGDGEISQKMKIAVQLRGKRAGLGSEWGEHEDELKLVQN